MNKKDLQKIEINVHGRKFPVKITEEEEVSVRKIEKQVNDKIKEFKLRYTGIEMEDCLSMVLLTYAFDLHKSSNFLHDQQFTAKMDELESMLDTALL